MAEHCWWSGRAAVKRNSAFQEAGALAAFWPRRATNFSRSANTTTTPNRMHSRSTTAATTLATILATLATSASGMAVRQPSPDLVLRRKLVHYAALQDPTLPFREPGSYRSPDSDTEWLLLEDATEMTEQLQEAAVDSGGDDGQHKVPSRTLLALFDSARSGRGPGGLALLHRLGYNMRRGRLSEGDSRQPSRDPYAGSEYVTTRRKVGEPRREEQPGTAAASQIAWGNDRHPSDGAHRLAMTVMRAAANDDGRAALREAVVRYEALVLAADRIRTEHEYYAQERADGAGYSEHEAEVAAWLKEEMQPAVQPLVERHLAHFKASGLADRTASPPADGPRWIEQHRPYHLGLDIGEPAYYLWTVLDRMDEALEAITGAPGGVLEEGEPVA